MAKMFYPSFEAINHKSDLTFSEWQNTLLETSGQGGGGWPTVMAWKTKLARLVFVMVILLTTCIS